MVHPSCSWPACMRDIPAIGGPCVAASHLAVLYVVGLRLAKDAFKSCGASLHALQSRDCTSAMSIVEHRLMALGHLHHVSYHGCGIGMQRHLLLCAAACAVDHKPDDIAV